MAGFNDKETGLRGLLMDGIKGAGSTTWTWTNSVSWFCSMLAGSTLTITSLTTSPWSLQEDLWASRINAISSFSALRAAISSSSFLFLLSQPSTSTWRVSIWSNLLFLHLAAANLFLSLLILLFSSSSGSRSGSSSLFLLLLLGLITLTLLMFMTLEPTTLGTHCNSARMMSPLFSSVGDTTVALPPPHRAYGFSPTFLLARLAATLFSFMTYTFLVGM